MQYDGSHYHAEGITMHLFRTCLLIALMALAGGAHARRPHNTPGQFDYYVLALSWSPSYCAQHRDPDQCAPGRRHGFVLHGLWPQFEKGYPASCSTEDLPGGAHQQYGTLFPSPRMAGHEWRKHGTCSGLAPAAYFALTSRLKQQTVVPKPLVQPAAPLRMSHAQLVAEFNTANPGMARYAVLPFCADGGRFLREVHVCTDKNGASRSCSEGAVKRSYNSCRQETFLIQNVR